MLSRSIIAVITRRRRRLYATWNPQNPTLNYCHLNERETNVKGETYD